MLRVKDKHPPKQFNSERNWRAHPGQLTLKGFQILKTNVKRNGIFQSMESCVYHQNLFRISGARFNSNEKERQAPISVITLCRVPSYFLPGFPRPTNSQGSGRGGGAAAAGAASAPDSSDEAHLGEATKLPQGEGTRRDEATLSRPVGGNFPIGVRMKVAC